MTANRYGASFVGGDKNFKTNIQLCNKHFKWLSVNHSSWHECYLNKAVFLKKGGKMVLTILVTEDLQSSLLYN